MRRQLFNPSFSVLIKLDMGIYVQNSEIHFEKIDLLVVIDMS